MTKLSPFRAPICTAGQSRWSSLRDVCEMDGCRLGPGPTSLTVTEGDPSRDWEYLTATSSVGSSNRDPTFGFTEGDGGAALDDCVPFGDERPDDGQPMAERDLHEVKVILATHCVTCGEDGDLLPCREHPECCTDHNAQGFSPVMGSDANGNPTVNTVAAIAEYRSALDLRSDSWVIAAGGRETPFLRNGRWYLYVYNPAAAAHGYLDLREDVVYDDMWSGVSIGIAD